MHEIAKFLAGFRRFQASYFCNENNYFEELKQGQNPETLVISCCDSRVDPALLMDCAPGELFVVRNVANLVPPYEPDKGHHGVSAALEYAVTSLEVKHVIVLGHGNCGGIKALMGAAQQQENAKKSEFIGKWVDIAASARDKVLTELPHKSPEMQRRACEQAAVLVSLDNLLTFPWLRERVENQQLMLHGWYFDLERGELFSFIPQTSSFEILVSRCSTGE